MNLPEPDDYIDIHNHGAGAVKGIFSVETLMAHEEREPENIRGLAFSIGIHPWHLNEDNYDRLIGRVKRTAGNPYVALIGEAGFDKIKGPSPELQQKAFREQAIIAGDHGKPMVIHCVRSWEELFIEHRRLKPKMPWLIHGFRGKQDLALQLVSKGMYISFWFDFVMRTESAAVLRAISPERIFLETDGADVEIKDIYNKVSLDLGITVHELKIQIRNNFFDFFGGKNEI